jgi:hypothetical protein
MWLAASFTFVMLPDPARAGIAYQKVRRDHFLANVETHAGITVSEFDEAKLKAIGLERPDEKPHAVVLLTDLTVFKLYDFSLRDGHTSVLFKHKTEAQSEIEALEEELGYLSGFVHLLGQWGTWEKRAASWEKSSLRGASYLARFIDMDLKTEVEGTKRLLSPTFKETVLKGGWKPKEYKRFAYLCTRKLEDLAGLPDKLPQETSDWLRDLLERIKSRDHLADGLGPLKIFMKGLCKGRSPVKIGLCLDGKTEVRVVVRVMAALPGVELSLAVNVEPMDGSRGTIHFWKAPLVLTDPDDCARHAPPPYIARWNDRVGRTKYYVGQVLCNYSLQGIFRAAGKIIAGNLPVAEAVRLDLPNGAGADEMILLSAFLHARGARHIALKKGE